jgi:hypothetical protein
MFHAGLNAARIQIANQQFAVIYLGVMEEIIGSMKM